MESTLPNNLERLENSNALNGDNGTLEYVLLNKIDYEYIIEEFLIDTNRFQILEEKESIKKEEKEKKKSKTQKDKSNKKKKGGKKNKKEEEDLSLSKASSNLSIFTIKSKPGNVKQSADQKIKAILAAQKNLTVNVLLDKKKNQIQIIKTEKTQKENLPGEEEIIDTNIKKIEEDEESKKPQQKKGNNKKKNEKIKEKSKQQIQEKPSKDNEKANQQNKRVEDFLKSVKEKKTSKAVKEEKKISIKSEFTSSHKYLFIVDPTQRLKLRNLYKLDKDTIQSFFDLVHKAINFDGNPNIYEDNNEELLKNNIKETAFLIDNLCELSIINETDEEIHIIIGRALDLMFSCLKLYLERYQNNPNQFKSEQLKSSLENFIMNCLYSLYKYQIEGLKITEENITRIQEIEQILTNLFKLFVKNKCGKINLKDDEEFMFYFFSYGLCLIILSHNRDSKEILDSFDKLNSNVNSLFTALKIYEEDSSCIIEDDYDKFLEDYSNLIFFTRFSYLFDKVRPNLFVLSIKVSKSIESNLTQIQNNLIRRNENLFVKLINKIILDYIHNFEVFYEINENLYEEIFGLIKYLCDDKVFSVIFTSQLFITSPNKFDKRLELENYTFLSDDITGKYIGLLIRYIKYFERVITTSESDLNVKENEYKLFLFYFHQVLFSILNLRQGYVKEKYYKIIEKLIEPYLKSDQIAEMIFEYITEFIKNNLLKEFDNNLLKNIKIAKDLTKFYSGYDQVKKNILNIFDKTIKNKIEYSLFTLFYLNFLNLNKKEDVVLLHSLIGKSENFIENVLFLDKRLCSFIMKNYINDEINSLDGIVNVIFQNLINKKTEENNNISFDNLFSYLLNFLKNVFLCKNNSDKISNLKLATDLIEKLISLNLLTVEKLEILLKNLLLLSKHLQTDYNTFNILKTTILFILNKIILIWKNSSNSSETHLKSQFEFLTILIENIKKELFSNSNSEFSIVKEITLINDNLKKIQPTEYLKTFEDNFLFTMETLKLQQLLQSDPDYFKIDTVEIEKIEQVSEIEVKTTKEADMDKINFDLILYGYLNYFAYIRNIISKYNVSKMNMDDFIFNLINQQESINIVLSSEKLFTNLIKNKSLLEEFVRNYIALKELGYAISEDSHKILKKLEASTDSHALINNQLEISKNITIIELTRNISVFCGEFIKNRCGEQIVYLFKEHEIYKMFLTKDKEFLQLLYENLNSQYKKTILNEENLKILLSKAQNEEEDLVEEVVYSIFSEKIIKHLEYPEEIIEFLTAMNEAMKYDLKVDTKKYYTSILSYLYTWKSIMSKIENGFKLYTTEKNLVTVVDSYKTLLKFIVNYLEKNTKIYEMFLLLTMSLIHLIDEEKYLEDKSTSYHLDKFDDSSLTDELDTNSFQFLLSVLYKFVKIFPSLVKFYYEETKTKLKNTFKSLNTNIILPKMLNDLRERIQANAGLLAKYQMRIRDTKSLNYLEFDFNANDEIKFVIEIRIPPIFPLKKLDINFKCNAVIDERKLLNVKMNLNQTLNSSIDNITDNLINWTENVKQLVIVGNEPCPICYFILHTTDKSLPGLSCKTCKKKFHGLCIKEWFKNLTQNMQQTSCPMCRSQWKL